MKAFYLWNGKEIGQTWNMEKKIVTGKGLDKQEPVTDYDLILLQVLWQKQAISQNFPSSRADNPLTIDSQVLKTVLHNFNTWPIYLLSFDTIAAQLLKNLRYKITHRPMERQTDVQTGLIQYIHENVCFAGI